MDVAQVCAALGLTVGQLYALMNNAQFPTPVSNDGNGGIVWNDSDITTFAATLAAALANGWQIDLSTQLASADFATLAATTPGPAYQGSGDPFGDVLDAFPGAPLVSTSLSPSSPPSSGGAFVFSKPANSIFAAVL